MVAKLLRCNLHEETDRKHPGNFSNQGHNSYVNFWKGDFVFDGTVYKQILAEKKQYLAHFKASEIHLAFIQHISTATFGHTQLFWQL